jgi:hypothetical protein
MTRPGASTPASGEGHPRPRPRSHLSAAGSGEAYLRARPTPDEQLAEYVDNFRRRVLQDALNEATASYWLRRAEDFERAKPRREKYRGQATDDDLRTAWQRCDQAAQACRARATTHDDTTTLIALLLEETDR